MVEETAEWKRVMGAFARVHSCESSGVSSAGRVVLLRDAYRYVCCIKARVSGLSRYPKRCVREMRGADAGFGVMNGLDRIVVVDKVRVVIELYSEQRVPSLRVCAHMRGLRIRL